MLAVLAYLPAQSLPFIADDYVQIRLARDYGPSSGWSALVSDPLYRCRATSIVATYWTEQFFGIDPLAFNVSSLLLHIFNTWLVFALGTWRVIGWRTSALAAAFFAVSEGHQEAVMWYAAVPELLVFLFSMLSFLCWIASVQAGTQQDGTQQTGTQVDKRYYALSILFFLLALASKESAVVIVGLQILTLFTDRRDWRKGLLRLCPFILLAACYASLIFTSQSSILHFRDGAFSPQAPFGTTALNSAAHLLWFWGALGMVFIVLWREPVRLQLAAVSCCWILITLLPYSFLTYMSRVPSRHTYFASVGLALIVAAGMIAFRDHFRFRPRLAALTLGSAILLQNATYLWTKKQRQYERRAAPTEQLIRLVRESDLPIRVDCFPYSRYIAQYAVEIGAGKRWEQVTWNPDPERCGGDEYRFSH